MQQKKRARILKLIIIGGLVGSLVIVWSLYLKSNGTRRPERYLLPLNYIGNFRVDYGIKGAPPLPIKNGFYIYKIPPSGYLKTSSLPEYGVATDEYYYVTKSGWQRIDSWSDNRKVWEEIIGSGEEVSPNGTRTSTSLNQQTFIGTNQQYTSSNQYHIGPIDTGKS